MRALRGLSAAIVLIGATALVAPPALAESSAAATGYAGPARGVTQHPLTPDAPQQLTSRNWAGYVTYLADHGTDFVAVKAAWVEPKVKCKVAGSRAVFWVGLDGWGSNTVEQGGAQAACPTQGGAAQHSLWWEMYPSNLIQTVLAIDAGDTITASVTYSPKAKVFTIKVRDLTSKQGFTRHETCASNVTCARVSADVITEAVGFGSGYYPLADYGTMGYKTIAVTDVNGVHGAITNGHWRHGAVTERDATTTYATVSKLSAHGTAFTVTWKHQ